MLNVVGVHGEPGLDFLRYLVEQVLKAPRRFETWSLGLPSERRRNRDADLLDEAGAIEVDEKLINGSVPISDCDVVE
jgi:hypothetical protein